MTLRPYKKIKELELIIEDLKRKNIEYKEREEERIQKEKRENQGYIMRIYLAWDARIL